MLDSHCAQPCRLHVLQLCTGHPDRQCMRFNDCIERRPSAATVDSNSEVPNTSAKRLFGELMHQCKIALQEQ